MEVLVGVCGSDHSFVALEETIERARQAGDDVTVGILDDPATDPTMKDIQAQVRSRIADAEISANIRHIEGDPAASLVEVAEAQNFDQLVVADGNHTPMGKIQVSSLAQYVLMNTQRTVKLVR